MPADLLTQTLSNDLPTIYLDTPEVVHGIISSCYYFIQFVCRSYFLFGIFHFSYSISREWCIMPSFSRKGARRPGLTKLEVLIAIGILASILAPFTPWVLMQRESSRREQCANNLKQIGIAFHNFEATFKRLPPLYGGSTGPQGTVRNSDKFGNVWGSTHFFLTPYVNEFTLSESSDIASGTNLPPSPSTVISSYICPSDPSMTNGMINEAFAGTSYTANAQMFAPLTDETINGGSMFPAGTPNCFDRGTTISRISDGASNTIGFIHSYALCGSPTTGTAWGYTAGTGNPPSPAQTFQPWSRATYIGQAPLSPPGKPVFQNRPTKPGTQASVDATGCDPFLPATPHADAMLVVMMDATIRSFASTVDPMVWNKACLPNNESNPSPDWGN